MIVDLEGMLQNLPRDPVDIGAISIVVHTMEAELSFSGGCADHEIDLVANNGWLESQPVQVGLFFSHEDNDDPCDAWLTETRFFDLRPLSEAYQAVYGTADPGTTTLVLRIEDPDEPGDVRLVDYVF